MHSFSGLIKPGKYKLKLEVMSLDLQMKYNTLDGTINIIGKFIELNKSRTSSKRRVGFPAVYLIFCKEEVTQYIMYCLTCQGYK